MDNEQIPDPARFEEDSDAGAAPPAGGPMSPEDVQAAVKQLAQQAVQYIEEELGPLREEATKYYLGKPLGNEEKGRSQIISTDVRDTVLGVMPSLMRVFHGPERTVELVPRTAESVAAAEQGTDYLFYIYNEDNPGFLETYQWLLDGFIRKTGVMKWWWEAQERMETYALTGLTTEQVLLLGQDPAVASYRVTSPPDASGAAPAFVDVEVTRRVSDGRARFECVPPEEAIWSRNARSAETATLFGHRRTMSVGEAYALGVAGWDELLEHAGANSELELNAEKLEREAASTVLDGDGESADPSSKSITISELWVRIDRDGDGIPERRKFWALGPDFHLVDDEGELANSLPFAVFCPYPEPHTLVGQSMADMTMDIQRIKTALLRGNLDSLGLALHPRMWMVDGAVNPKDAMNTEIGALMRVKAPGMLGEFAHSYVGKESFPLLSYMDEVKEQRTGQTKASNGLDADALQSSTKAAVAATLSAAQARTELLARLFAETAFRHFFKGLYQLVKEHQDAPRMVRLRGKFEAIDPRPWDAHMDVRVVVALGAGLTEDKLAVLGMIKQTQESILQLLGPANPLVTLDQYRHTLARMVELGGFRDVDSYFQPMTREQGQQLAQQAAQAPAPKDPATMLAEIEMQKAQAQLQMEQQKLQLEVQKAIWDHELRQREQEQAMLLKTRELELKYRADIDEAQMHAAIAGNKAALEAVSQRRQAETDAALRLHEIETNAAVKKQEAAAKATASKSLKIERGKDGRVSHVITESGPAQ